MKKILILTLRGLFLSSVGLLLNIPTFSQNPVIRDQYTADPSARVFNGNVYVYPSHNILAREGRGRPGFKTWLWFLQGIMHWKLIG